MLEQGLIRPGSYHAFEVFGVFVVLYQAAVKDKSRRPHGTQNAKIPNPRACPGSVLAPFLGLTKSATGVLQQNRIGLLSPGYFFLDIKNGK